MEAPAIRLATRGSNDAHDSCEGLIAAYRPLCFIHPPGVAATALETSMDEETHLQGWGRSKQNKAEIYIALHFLVTDQQYVLRVPYHDNSLVLRLTWLHIE